MPELASIIRKAAGVAVAEHIVPNSGHSPYYEDAPAFNKLLAVFVDSL